MLKNLLNKPPGPVSVLCAIYFFYLLFSVEFASNFDIFFRGYDSYWLLKTGGWIIDNAQIPHHNVLAGANPGLSQIPWTCYQWLFMVIAGFMHKLAGLHGVMWLCSAVLALSAALWGLVLYKKGYRGFPDIFAALLPAVFFLQVFADVRPFVFTIFFCSLLNVLLQNQVNFQVRYVYLPLVFLFWVNIHLGFVFGIFWLLLEMIIAARQEKSLKPLVVWFISFLATGINPSGFNLYGYLFTLGNGSYMNANITELQPFMTGADPVVKVWLFIGLAAFVFALKSGRIRLAEKVMLVVALVMTLVSLRHLCFLLVFMPVFYSEAINRLFKNFSTVFNSQKNDNMVFYTVLAVVAGFVLAYNRSFPLPELYKHLSPGFVGFVEANYVQGPVLTTGEIGSELLFHTKLSPFIDTRYDMYGDAYVREYTGLLSLEGNWRELLRQKKVNYILYPASYNQLSRLDRNLSRDNWEKLYTDGNLVLFFNHNK